jgi:hypothetical protein
MKGVACTRYGPWREADRTAKLEIPRVKAIIAGMDERKRLTAMVKAAG